MQEYEKNDYELVMTKFFAAHFMTGRVRQAYLDEGNLKVVFYSQYTGVRENAFAMIHRLKKLGLVREDRSEYKPGDLLPTNINLKLVAGADVKQRIQDYLDEEQNPVVERSTADLVRLKDNFRDNRLEYTDYGDVTRKKAVRVLRASLKSMAGVIFGTDFALDSARNNIRVEFRGAAKGRLLARPRFIITYDRPFQGGMTFGPDNAFLRTVTKAFQRSHELPVRVRHSADDAVGRIEISGSPQRLLHEMKSAIYNVG